jgi:DNA-binding IclR family transcriptional regulator
MNSVDNVARVLRLFTAERSIVSVTEVAQLLALPKSSSSRLLKAMAETGLLNATEQVSGYSVGNLIFETSRRHRAHSTLSVMADEALARIVKATGHTGYIAMLDRTDVLGLRMRPGSKPLRVVTSPGDRLAAFCSSTGRAMLARLDDEAVRALYPNPTPWQAPSPNAPQTVEDLLAALTVVRTKGWSQATDESLPGVESIAVCVEDRESGERVALCISYSAAMISANEKSRIVTLLMRAGCEIGMKFDDETWAAPRFAAFSAPSWNEAA